MKLTNIEKAWVRILTGLAFVIGSIILVQPLIPVAEQSEPLADPISLQTLVAGQELERPPEESFAVFHGQDVSVPEFALGNETNRILGLTVEATPGLSDFKRIEIDLSSQKVYAYEGARRVLEFTVSTGKWAPTPTGEFRIWAKVRSQKMEGGNKALHTYYYLPNVPYVMFFSNSEITKMRGFSLHGTYWHNNFGHPMSHGCVNMKIADAQTLYEWANPVVTNTKAWSTLASNDNPGTKVIVYGITPKE